MVLLKVQLRPNTSLEWIWGKILKFVKYEDQSLFDINEAPDGTTIVNVSEEDEIVISRAIRLISPLVIDVSRAQ